MLGPEQGRRNMLTVGQGFRLLATGFALILLAAPSAFTQTASAAGTHCQPSGGTDTPPQAPTTNQNTNQQVSVNPVTGETTALATHYRPLTADERWKLYFESSYWSIGAYFSPLFTALALDQATDSPAQWGTGIAGYGHRAASRLLTGNVVQASFQHSVAALLKEDVRYIASDQHGFGRRAWHAVKYSFLTYNRQGHPTPNIAGIGGFYVAAAASTTWLPGRRRTWSYTLSNGAQSEALSLPYSVVQEFWPEISHHLFHRK
jgi:hypothetical protein